jgi:hypothetical protein
MTSGAMRIKAAAMFLVLAACLAALASSAAADSPLTLTVRIYNSAHIPAPTLVAARRTAESMFEDTGLHVIFRSCGSRSAVADPIDPCSEPLKPAEFVVRVVDAPFFNPALHPEAFGVAYVVEETNRGWLATVFADRIRGASPRFGMEAGTLLGLVTAHEIGHLLLGVGYHGDAGVMRSDWQRQLVSGAREQWHFSGLESAAMRRAAIDF